MADFARVYGDMVEGNARMNESAVTALYKFIPAS
jgi:hypothetical protein